MRHLTNMVNEAIVNILSNMGKSFSTIYLHNYIFPFEIRIEDDKLALEQFVLNDEKNRNTGYLYFCRDGISMQDNS